MRNLLLTVALLFLVGTVPALWVGALAAAKFSLPFMLSLATPVVSCLLIAGACLHKAESMEG